MVTQIKVLIAAEIADPQRVGHFFEELLDMLGMQPLGEPQIYEVELEVSKLGREPFQDEGGISRNQHGVRLEASQVLSTSHVALHSWPLRKVAELDIFSCREFSRDDVYQLVRGFFEPEHIAIRDLSSYRVLPW